MNPSTVAEDLHIHWALALDTAQACDAVFEIGQIGSAELGDHVQTPTRDVVGDAVIAAVGAENLHGDQQRLWARAERFRGRHPAQRLLAVDPFDSITLV